MAKTSENNLCAVLSYLLIGIIWYFVDDKIKKDDFVKFHVKQGIILFITAIIINFIGSIIPFIGWFIILPIGELCVLILMIIGIVNALNNKKTELPVIGKFAEKLTF